jgi:glyoxylase-like metal-dependent hydrolase (beta-lactamase superfamily II)
MQGTLYSYQVGDIALTVISEGTLKGVASSMFGGIDEAAWRPLVETDDTGRFTIGMNIVHVAVGEHSILLDTGVGEPHPARARFEEAWPFAQTANLLSSLALMGIAPEQVTEVIFSHVHPDHVLGATVERDGQRVPTFPNARYLLLQDEWSEATSRAQPGSPFSVHFPILQEHNLLELIEGEFEVVPGVRIVPAPGESAGHAIVRIESRGQLAFYVGDLFHHPAEVTHLDWVWPGRDQAQMLASRQAVVDEALSADAVIITAHMLAPGIGKLQQFPHSLEWVPLD